MFVVGMNTAGSQPEFEPVEVPTAADALTTLIDQLRHDFPGHPMDQLTDTDIENGYRVTAGGIEYWIRRR